MEDVKHWADQIAEDVIERVEKDALLKSIADKEGYIIYDEKTPSGKIHIGSGRGWIIHDTIAKALRDRGKKARFILSSDDMDPLDKPAAELSEEENKRYMGVPFRYIPSPVDGYDNYGHYYFSLVTDHFSEFGIEAELESTGEQYEKGAFNRTIKIALDNTDKIQKIYAELYGEEAALANKLPFNVRCPNCGKIATTIALEWDARKEQISFECRDDIVKWAKGCGTKAWISPYNGNGKFPWKVEWAAKWPTKSVLIETAGKDHFTKGGSRTVACRIAVDVFDYPPPYPSKGYETGNGYEFFTVGGKKMSTSKGQGIGFAESVQYAPAQMLRFMLVRTRPNAVIDFDPYQSNDLILLYDRFDRAEKVYFGRQDDGEKENIKQKRIYELSKVGSLPERMPPQISLAHAGFLVQIMATDDEVIQNLRESSHIPEDVTKTELDNVKKRLEFARKWIAEFAEDQYKYTLQDKVPSVKISDKQKEALRILATELKKGKWSEDLLSSEIYEIARNKVGIEPKELFEAAYLVLLDRQKGPRLASFLLAVREKAIKLFEKV